LKPHYSGEQNVDFSRLDFLKVPSGDLRSFGELFLSPAPLYPLASNIRAEGLPSGPFFL
jgi:hypothetical protein